MRSVIVVAWASAACWAAAAQNHNPEAAGNHMAQELPFRFVPAGFSGPDLVSATPANRTAGLRNLAAGGRIYLVRVQVTECNPVAAAPCDVPPSVPAQEPVRIGLGQTPEQVEAAIGKPYQNLEITFVDGRVSDVQ